MCLILSVSVLLVGSDAAGAAPPWVPSGASASIECWSPVAAISSAFLRSSCFTTTSTGHAALLTSRALLVVRIGNPDLARLRRADRRCGLTDEFTLAV